MREARKTQNVLIVALVMVAGMWIWRSIESQVVDESEEPVRTSRSARRPLTLTAGQIASGIELLDKAALAALRGDGAASKALIENAIRAAPRLAAAHITLAQHYHAHEDYELADKHLSRGLALIDAPDQPQSIRLPSIGPRPVTNDELAGDSLVQHGLCLMLLAERAHNAGDLTKEQGLLGRAHASLTAALPRMPSPENRAVAESVLRKFR